jgi:hypothetical protein
MTMPTEPKVAALALSLNIEFAPGEPVLLGLLRVFDALREQGLVLLVKWDGERNPQAGDNGQYTALITGPPLVSADAFFRKDDSSMEAAMQDVLVGYYDWLGDRSE